MSTAPPPENVQNDFGTGADAGNSLSTATLIAAGSGTGYIDSTDTSDYYKVSVLSGQRISVSMTPPSGADFDLRLYDTAQTSIAYSAAAGSTTDTVEATATASGYYYIYVSKYSGSGTYSMTVTISAENVVENVPTTLTVSPSSFTLASGGSTTITMTLTDNAGNTLTNRTLALFVDNGGSLSSYSPITNSYGQTSVTYYAPTVTTTTYVTVTASFIAEVNYQASTTYSYGTITVENAVATLPAYLSVSPSSFSLQSGYSTTLTATLTDNGGYYLTSKTVTWSATAGSLSPTTGTTNAYGQTSVIYYAPSVTAATSVTVTASFAGDNSYQSNSGYSYGTITAENVVENVVAATAFTPPHSSAGSDPDGDGDYDNLVITVNLSVSTAGTYNLSASLYDNAGYYIGYASGAPYLSTGSQTAQLAFSGSSIYSSMANGPYTVYIYLYDSSWNWLGDNTYTTGTYTYTQFQPPAVALSPPHSDYTLDNNGDGIYDYLVIGVKVNVAQAGKYYLSGSLYSGYYENYITYGGEEVTLSAGTQAVPLHFSGESINRAKINGPYWVSLYFYDANYTYYESDNHTTSTYSYASFTSSAVSLTPPHSDRVLDNNGDGVYDYLVVDVNVSIRNAGKYYVSGSLYGSSTTYTYDNYTYTSYGSSVAWAWQETTLSAGTRTVSLYFDGTEIKRSGVNGPYTASISIYNETYTSYDYGEHTTGTYTYTQFGRAATQFSAPHSDTASDTDGDGFYNSLEVTVKLNVATAGSYSISASLYGENYTYIDYAWADISLSTGAQTATLRFDGQKIRQSKVNGPYTVDMSLYESWNWIDSGTHTTAAYSYTAFQAAAVELVPPHSDSGVDTDGDGYYDELAVDVKLKITTPGTYSVSGSLRGGTLYWDNYYLTTQDYTTTSYYGGTYIDYAWEEATLSTGTQTVGLSFDGTVIRQSGLDGPYTVELYVYGPHREEYGTYSWSWGTSEWGTHTTASYTADQFQAPGASFSSPHSDEGSDTNGDGLYDYLVVNANVNVTTPGKYHVSGSLMGGASLTYYSTYRGQENAIPAAAPPPAASDVYDNYGYGETYETVPTVSDTDYYGTYGTYIDYAWADVDLSTGTQTVELTFSGMNIRSSGVDGPYYVSLSLSDGEWNWLGSATYTTASYKYTDFQTLPIEFSTPHADSGTDTDGDGLYDYLDVNVKVNVSTAGTYLIAGTITPSYYLASYAAPEAYETRQATTTSTTYTTYAPIIAMKRATLSTGSQTVQLRFPGGLIYQSGQNGPYYISLSIVENLGTWSSLDYASYTTTGAYSYTDFELPLATLSPPHTDYGSDTDGDGLYNKLVVDVNLNVRTAGNFKVLGLLMESGGGFGVDFIDRTIKDVTLESGQQSVRLEFKGWKIYSSHVEGSMMVGILLLDPNVTEQVWYDVGGVKIPLAGWVGLGTHYTAAYSYNQFQPTAPAYTAMVINQPVGQLSLGQAGTVDLRDRKLPTLAAVTVAARSGTASPTVSVIEEIEVPAGLPEVEGALSYITITVENADGQSFTLSIPRERMENLGIDPATATVKVYRFQEDWAEVTVEKTGEDADYIYYKVTTPGFSVFAVTAAGAQLPTQPFVSVPPIWIIVITAIVLIGALIAVIWRYLSIGGKRVEEIPRPPKRLGH